MIWPSLSSQTQNNLAQMARPDWPTGPTHRVKADPVHSPLSLSPSHTHTTNPGTHAHARPMAPPRRRTLRPLPAPSSAAAGQVAPPPCALPTPSLRFDSRALV